MSGRQLADFEKYHETKVLNDSMWLLEKFLGKSLPRPISIVTTKWLTNKNFLGSYSYPSVDATKNKVSAKDLAQPLFSATKPVVLFAGEATSEFFAGDTNGAVRSGWKAAKELVAYMNETKA